MRDGIVDVQQVEAFVGRHVVHLRGQRQRVGRMVEQRIVHHFNFVEVNPFGSLRHAHGHGVADEVDVVAPRRQLQAELGGHHAASAVGGITGDADFHNRVNSPPGSGSVSL